MSAKGKIIQVQGDNPSLLGKIDTPPPEERTPPCEIFDLVHLWLLFLMFLSP